VQFRRSGVRRYAVSIFRPGLPMLEKNPVPGYDDLLPHDLIHLIVERALGLQRGIFGQAAEGGTAGMFYPVESDARTAREASRQRRMLAKRSDKLMQAGRQDTAASEAATYIARMAWDSRRANRSPRVSATRIGPVLAEQLAQIRDEMDAMSARWMALPAGEVLSVRWPV
jgi:hypothetical protein